MSFDDAFDGEVGAPPRAPPAPSFDDFGADFASDGAASQSAADPFFANSSSRASAAPVHMANFVRFHHPLTAQALK